LKPKMLPRRGFWLGGIRWLTNMSLLRSCDIAFPVGESPDRHGRVARCYPFFRPALRQPLMLAHATHRNGFTQPARTDVNEHQDGPFPNPRRLNSLATKIS